MNTQIYDAATLNQYCVEISDLHLPFTFSLLPLVFPSLNRGGSTIAVSGAASEDVESGVDSDTCG